MQAISARISSEDFEWLASLDVPGASTPSDKVRALLSQLRKQHEGATDYSAGLTWMRELVAPVMAAVGTFEHRAGLHSELIRVMGEWVPQCMAVLLASAQSNDRKAAFALEEQLANRAFQLVTAVLRISLPPDTDTYDPKFLNRHVPAVLELAQHIASQRTIDVPEEKTHG